MGKPASMMSTPNSTKAWAISIFSCRFMLAPGDCSLVSQGRIEYPNSSGFVHDANCPSLPNRDENGASK